MSDSCLLRLTVGSEVGKDMINAVSKGHYVNYFWKYIDRKRERSYLRKQLKLIFIKVWVL